MYDLGIIGAGPAGYVAAERAGHKGLKVVIFDKRQLGGVCLNEGCIPTKTLLYTAKLYENALHGDKYGVSCLDVSFDIGKIMDRKEKVVKKLVGGVAARMKSVKVYLLPQALKLRFLRLRDLEKTTPVPTGRYSSSKRYQRPSILLEEESSVLSLQDFITAWDPMSMYLRCLMRYCPEWIRNCVSCCAMN